MSPRMIALGLAAALGTLTLAVAWPAADGAPTVASTATDTAVLPAAVGPGTKHAAAEAPAPGSRTVPVAPSAPESATTPVPTPQPAGPTAPLSAPTTAATTAPLSAPTTAPTTAPGAAVATSSSPAAPVATPGSSGPVQPADDAAPTEAYEGPGTVDEPVYACLHVEARPVCDTFGEADEGPGTN